MQFGHYKILRKIGKGGMGAVYRVLDSNSAKIFALKILDPFEVMLDVIGVPLLREMFVAEARLMGRLNHPAVVDVVADGVDRLAGRILLWSIFVKTWGR